MAIKQKLTGSGAAPQLAQVITGTKTTGITATGSTQGTAQLISDDWNVITTAAASTGVLLRSDLSQGDSQVVVNYGANSVTVYPPVGGAINNGSANAGVAVAANGNAIFTCLDSLNFISK